MSNTIQEHLPSDSPHQQALYLLGFSTSAEHANATEMTHETGLNYASTAMLRHLGIEHLNVVGLSAWYKVIDRVDFEGEQGERNLADIQWLTPRVIAHERVVSELSQQIPFYPARFGTLFSSKASLISFASNVHGPLNAFFCRIGVKREYGLKFYGDPMRAAEVLAQKDGLLQNGKPVGGANYLKLRQMQRARSAATQSLLAQSFKSAHALLQARFQDIVARPLIAANNEAKGEELLGNLALLLDFDDAQSLHQWVLDWNQSSTSGTGLRVEATGPWPAYSFCPSLAPTQATEAA